MASWDEVRAHLERTYAVGIDDGTLFGLDVKFGDGRKQRVFASTHKTYGKQFLQLRSLVAKVDKIDPAEALATSSELALGGLMIDGGMYFLQYRLILDDVAPEAVDFPLRTLAAIADNLEAAHAGGGRDMF